LTKGNINSLHIAEKYGVSSETIRKDLLYLEQQGIAKKGYGGAVIASEMRELSFARKVMEHQEQKTQIAKAAVDIVEDGSSLLLDSGSTVLCIAEQIALKKNVTVFTNSLKSAQCLSNYGVRVYLLGGEVRSTSNAVVGGWALEALREIRVDLAFMGTSGFCQRQGPCIENFNECDVKRAMIHSAVKTAVVADSSKAQSNALVQFARWEELDLLITNAGADPATLEALRKKIKVITV